MKKLLCPTDFSETARNGIEYAAHLAKMYSAQLTLFYVQSSIWPEASQLEHDVMVSTLQVTGQLQIICREVHREFRIPCDYFVDRTVETMEEAIARKAKEFDLIVMGTNGADNLFQHVFGSNSFRVIGEARRPICVVPQQTSYRPVRMIVYGYDPGTNPIFLIDQLKRFATPLHAEVRVLHVTSRPQTPDSNRRMKILETAVKARQTKALPLSFDCRYAENIAWELDQYVKAQDADLLALSFHHRSMMESIFRENVIRQISRISDYPALIFWH